MKISKLNLAQLSTVCGYGETHFYDRKSLRITPSKLTKTLSAFANADGGELLVGIEDNHTWVGAPEIEDFNGHVQGLEEFFPYGTDFDYEFLQHPTNDSFILRVTIQKTRDIRTASDGVAYGRRGAQNIPIKSDDALARLHRQKGITTHETQTLSFPTDEISNSLVILEFAIEVVPEAEPIAWLRKQRLVVDEKPTVVGTVLFHDEPQVHLPKASVKIYRYTTVDAEGSREQLAFDPITIEGSLYTLIATSVRRTVEEVEKIPVLDEGLD